jgi:hypothetical protein
VAGQCLDAYQSAERVLVTGVEERLTAREREQLALGYRAALAGAPTARTRADRTPAGPAESHSGSTPLGRSARCRRLTAWRDPP